MGLTPQSIYKLGTYSVRTREETVYPNQHEQVTGAVRQYIADVKSSDFPNASEQY